MLCIVTLMLCIVTFNIIISILRYLQRNMCSVKETGLFSIEFHFKSFFLCERNEKKTTRNSQIRKYQLKEILLEKPIGRNNKQEEFICFRTNSSKSKASPK